VTVETIVAPSLVLRGCRRAELAGFRWAGADLDRGVLTVARPIVQLGGKLTFLSGSSGWPGWLACP
jgi:hypothetical protein